MMPLVFFVFSASAGQINVQLNNYAREINAGAISLNGAANGTAEANNTNTNTDQASISTSVTTQTDNSWVVDVVGSGDAGAFFPGNGQTEWFDQSSGTFLVIFVSFTVMSLSISTLKKTS